MVFWSIIVLMAAAVVAVLVRGAARGAVVAPPASDFDVQVYRDQLAEVDRDLARGTLNPEDAERTRTEISRRILAADAARTDTVVVDAPKRGSALGVGILALGLIGGSAALYQSLGAPGYGDLSLKDRIAGAEALRASRPEQADAEASLDAAQLPPVAPQSPDYVAAVEQLRTVVADRPDDARGLQLLAISERNLGNFSAAHKAFGQYIAVRGTEATPQEFADLADMMVLAAGGYVSPEAEAALQRALEGDPGNGPARYYWGLMQAQTGRPDQAFQLWDRMLRAGPPDAPWIPPIQAQIDEIALRAGVVYSQPLPGGGTRGPSADDIEAAGDMSAGDRMQMIEGMVSGLSERLSTEGGTVDEWAQLITALGVLGRRENAFAVYQNAVEMFGGDPAAMDLISRAGSQAGVAE